MSTSTVNISATQVKELREKTGAPMMDCKQALTEAKGDMEQAVVVLRKKGVSVAAKKATRVTSEGSVASYIHAGGKIGVLVEVNCESDFVARTEDFKELVHDIAMHIAASDPKFVRKEDVTPEDFEREKDICRLPRRSPAASLRTSRRRWSKARWPSFTKRSACWSSLSSRTRRSASRSSSPPRSASWERTSPYAASRDLRWATRARPSPSPSQNRKLSNSGALMAPLFFVPVRQPAKTLALQKS